MIFTMRIVSCCQKDADHVHTPKDDEMRAGQHDKVELSIIRASGLRIRPSDFTSGFTNISQVERRNLAVICDFILYD